MKMSEICRKAANEHLWDGVYPYRKVSASCLAVRYAANNYHAEREYSDAVMVSSCRPEDFCDSYEKTKTQGARFMLLHFAALYFEDLGE
jgi:hypothetical protein